MPSTLGAGPPASPTAAPSLRPEGLQSSSHTQPLPGHAHQLWLDTGWRKRERAWWDPRPGRSALHGATTLRRETQRETGCRARSRPLLRQTGKWSLLGGDSWPGPGTPLSLAWPGCWESAMLLGLSAATLTEAEMDVPQKVILNVQETATSPPTAQSGPRLPLSNSATL